MKKLSLTLAACAALNPPLSLAVGPIVDLGYAQYQGITNTTQGVNTFYGIRYAQPPTGELRWRAPLDIEASNNCSASTPIDATVPGLICVQGVPAWAGGLTGGSIAATPMGSEDCLLLNIYTPASPASSSLPVMVQIHGGGYTLGSALQWPGNPLVQQSNGNLVYVSIQYRLGAFGFLSSAEIKENGTPNAGLLDMRAALNWVQRNIRAFGGDPSKVTIIGGSAGGGAVMNQMILYGGAANPPFRAVISEYPWWQPYHNNTVLESQYRELLADTNCSDLGCLRSVSSTTLITASQKTYLDGYDASPEMYYGYGDFYYGPSVDGDIIRDLPSTEFKVGHFTKVPLLVNHDGYEGVLFSNTSETTPAEVQVDFQSLFPYAHPSFFTRLAALYPAASFNLTFFDRQAVFGDFIIDCPTYYMATAVSDAGLPAYKLIFDAGSELHGATLPFLFDDVPTLEGTPGGNATLGLIMKDWYLSFAITLDPNAVAYTNITKPSWGTYQSLEGSEEFGVMSVNYTMVGMVDDTYFDASPRCDFFHGQSYVVRN